jgi:hypothetical protein
MKKKTLLTALLSSICFVSSMPHLSYAKTLYADHTNSFQVCIAPNTIFSVDVPCKLKSVSYSNNMKGNISNGSPHTAFFFVIQNKENKKLYGDKASFALACSNISYSFIAKLDKSCTDNHFDIINPSAVSPSEFKKQDIINMSAGIMRAMLRGEVPFGFRRLPVHIEQPLYSKDLVMDIYYTYVGSNFVGFQGYVINKNPLVSYQINIPLLMQKGWVLLYMGTPNFGRKTIIEPNQKIPFDVVAIASEQTVLPYKK